MDAGERGIAPNGCIHREARLTSPLCNTLSERKLFMAKHLNPLEKEFLIRQFKGNPQVKLSDFCTVNNVSDAAFRKWLKQYEDGGVEGLARADSMSPDVLPEGVERTEESYKREILRLKIELERAKKNYTVEKTADGEQVYIRLKTKTSP